MARAKTAQPVKGGQMAPEAMAQAARSRQLAQEKAMLGMRETAATERTKIGARAQTGAAAIQAASREAVARTQAETAKETAAMQQQAEAERTAQQMRDNQAGRDLQMQLAQNRERFAGETERLRQQREDALHNQNKELLEKTEAEAKQLNKNKALFDRRTTAINGKIALETVKLASDRADRKEAAQQQRDVIQRNYDRDRGRRDLVVQQVRDAYESNSNLVFESKKTTMGKIGQKFANLPAILPPVAIGRIVTDAIRGDIDTGIRKEVHRKLQTGIGEILSKQTKGQLGLKIDRQDLQQKILQGSLGYGELLNGITTLHTLKERLQKELDVLPKAVETGDFGDDWSNPAKRGLVEGYRAAFKDVTDAIGGLEQLRTSEAAIGRFYIKAAGIYHESGVEELLAAVERAAPRDVDRQIEIVRQIIEQTPLPGEFVGETAGEFREREEFRESNIGQLVLMINKGMGD